LWQSNNINTNKVIASGYGKIENDENSNELMKVQLTLQNIDVCRDLYEDNPLDNRQICVGGDGAKDTCQVSKIFYEN
jgi:hypothetical protein